MRWDVCDIFYVDGNGNDDDLDQTVDCKKKLRKIKGTPMHICSPSVYKRALFYFFFTTSSILFNTLSLLNTVSYIVNLHNIILKVNRGEE